MSDPLPATEPVHWVEFYGGPDDGTMAGYPWSFKPGGRGIVLHGFAPPLGDGVFRNGPLLGYYRPSDWLDEELRIIRMDWTPA